MAEKTVSNENKEIAKYISSVIGTTNRKVAGYLDDKEENSLDIFSCDDAEDPNIQFYCTIGLSDYENLFEMKDGKQNIPIEILMAGYKEFDKIPNILSTCGFYFSKDKWNCQPGSVFMRIVDVYHQKEMRHIMFVPPFLWEELKPLKLETKTVNWLLAVPISDNELEYKEKNGFDALQELFEEKEIDIFDLDRKSVV